MPRATLVVVTALLLPGCATAPTSKLQRTQDGTALVGHVAGGFRIAAYGADFTMTPPQGWGVVLCTERPLDAHAVCGAPDGTEEASVTIWDASPGPNHSAEKAAPEAYLRMLRGSRDRDIQMKREPDLVLADGRRLPVWRFYSEYWGERFYVTFPAGSAVVSVEVVSETSGAALRNTLRALLESYRPNPYVGCQVWWRVRDYFSSSVSVCLVVGVILWECFLLLLARWLSFQRLLLLSVPELFCVSAPFDQSDRDGRGTWAGPI